MKPEILDYQACSIREEETVLERFFGVLEILEHSLPSDQKVSVMEVLDWDFEIFRLGAVDCSWELSFNGNCRYFPGYFPKFLVQLFLNIVMTSSVMEFNRVLGL